jgi:LacI family transcriptional regulator
MPKTTIKDVALQTGLSTATVERVINGRGGVTQDTIHKVLAAAERLQYGIRQNRTSRRTIRIEVILVRPETSFFARVNQAFERIAASLDRSVIIHRTFVAEGDHLSMARHIDNPSFRRSGLIICAQDHPRVAASLRRVRAAGVEVVQIVTRCDDHDVPYVGIDNYAAGRSAAFYMSGMLAGRAGHLVALCHSGIYMNHRERVHGFSDYIAERVAASGHSVSEVMMAHDDDVRAADLLAQALGRNPDLIGVYSVGGGDEGVASVLQKWALKGRPIFWVGHELTERKKGYFKSGLLDICLDEAPEVQARRSLDLILRKLGVMETAVDTSQVRFVTVNAQNV